MKILKKVTAFILAAVMVLSVNCVVLAAGATPDSLPGRPDNNQEVNLSEHTFKAYQIFSGTQTSQQGNKVTDGLLELNWGEGIDRTKFLEELKKSSEFSNVTYDAAAPEQSALAIAEIISKWSSDDANARTFARIASQCITGSGISKGSTLSPGYYLVVDVTNTIGTNDAKNLAVLMMYSRDTVFDPDNKTGVPELEKKVWEANDSDNTGAWQDVADYDIGDEVRFVLTGTLPENYNSYKYYKYVFHDTLSPGLKLNAGSIAVKVNGETARGYNIDVSPATGRSFSITFNDLKTSYPNLTQDALITIEYGAELTAAAVVGGTGNKNTAFLEYSNDPNYDPNGTPGTPPEEPPTGETPKEIVTVFSYQLLVNKVDKDGEPLPGADFTLYKLSAGGAYEAVNPNPGATQAPNSDPAKSDTTEENLDITSQSEESETNQTSPLEEPVEVQRGGGDSGTTTFTFKGLDAGKYKLVETVVPAGYNKADDLYFEITSVFGGDDGQTLMELVIEKVYYNENSEGEEIKLKEITNEKGEKVFAFAGEVQNGSLTGSIANYKGSLLPASGGIGTTIFYVLGSIMIIGAVVLLIVRTRIKKNK